jgi:hypothetical protein
MAERDGGMSEQDNANTERPTCKTCPYWKQIEDANLYGECRRFPAYQSHQMDVGSEEEGKTNIDLATWADTEEDDWCGEHPDFPAYIAGLKKS